MLPRDPRRPNTGRGNRGGKVDRAPARPTAPATRPSGNAPVMGTVIGFSPAAATVVTSERMLFTFQVLIGYTVEVQVNVQPVLRRTQIALAALPTYSTRSFTWLQVKAGSVYQGIFSTAQIENSELHIVLQMAKIVREADQSSTEGTVSRKPIKELIIRSADLVSLSAKDVRMGADDLSRPAEDSLNTDSAISRGRGG